jgi:hypothetical protein
MRKTKTVEERFFEKVVKTDGCWVWLGSKGRRGYGALHVIVNGVVSLTPRRRRGSSGCVGLSPSA